MSPCSQVNVWELRPNIWIYFMVTLKSGCKQHWSFFLKVMVFFFRVASTFERCRISDGPFWFSVFWGEYLLYTTCRKTLLHQQCIIFSVEKFVSVFECIFSPTLYEPVRMTVGEGLGFVAKVNVCVFMCVWEAEKKEGLVTPLLTWQFYRCWASRTCRMML